MSTARYIIGDTREQLAKLPDASVDLVLSSPPFLALRSYLPADHPDKANEIGSEPTPGEFLDVILDVVEACARVLTPHGSLVFEFGDTYAAAGSGAGRLAVYSDDRGNPDGMRDSTFSGGNTTSGGGQGWPLDKSLTLIPESFAWALAYGRNPWTGRTTDPWRIRNFCPWVRPNPPVGALGDKFRPGTSYLTVACKARDRWFDLDAVRTPHTEPGASERFAGTSNQRDQARVEVGLSSGAGFTAQNPNGAPPLDWFNIPTQPYAGSHYATWPERLALPFIESMCPRQVCTECGEPRRRLTGEAEYVNNGGKPARMDMNQARKGGDGVRQFGGQGDNSAHRIAQTLGWSDCGHDSWRNGLVLDPFAGSGTTLQVATGCGRDAIGIDLDERNLELARARIGMFLEEPAA